MVLRRTPPVHDGVMVGLKRAVAAWILASFFLLLAATALARPPFVDKIWGGVPGYGMPNYFSGTNSRVNMTVGTTPGGIKRVEFRIGGELVWEADYPNPALPPYIVTVATQKAVMFDSTRFAPGNNLSVEVKVWSWTAPFRSFSQVSPVKNAVLLAKHPDPEIFGDPPQVVYYELGPSRFNFGFEYGEWTPRDFVDGLSGKSVVYVCSHGQSNRFAAGKLWDDGETEYPTYVQPYGNDVYVVGYPEWQERVGVEPFRIPQMGSGYPPFNSTGNPPITLVFVSSCSTAALNDFI